MDLSKEQKGSDKVIRYLLTIFFIVIEVLSPLSPDVALGGQMDCHSYCQKVGPTHLGFIDELLVFLKGSISLLQAVLDVFEQRRFP